MNPPTLFRTVVPVAENPRPIALNHTILSIGSCFAEIMGRRLRDYRFHSVSNPAGVLFNPRSVADCLRRGLRGTPYARHELFEHESLWHSLDHHSEFSAGTADECLTRINTRLAMAHRQMARLDTLLVTFGTALAFCLRDEKDRVASNCHKLPATQFDRRLLTVESIVADWVPLLEQLYAQRPDLNVIITVSPVRHLRDEPHENTVSKAHLVCAVHALEQRFPQLYYFPAYEIVLDELRDYRFFAPDMAHPNETAGQYVWQQFAAACLAPRAQQFVHELDPVFQGLTHTHHHPGSSKARESRRRLEERLAALRASYPEAVWDDAPTVAP